MKQVMQSYRMSRCCSATARIEIFKKIVIATVGIHPPDNLSLCVVIAEQREFLFVDIPQRAAYRVKDFPKLSVPDRVITQAQHIVLSMLPDQFFERLTFLKIVLTLYFIPPGCQLTKGIHQEKEPPCLLRPVLIFVAIIVPIINLHTLLMYTEPPQGSPQEVIQAR